MANVLQLTFNPFQENTYLIYDDTQECIILDPGCSTPEEQAELITEIDRLALRPVRLINTHCHIDHVLGNRFISNTFGLTLEAHQGEQPVLDSGLQVASMYHIPYDPSPAIGKFLTAGDLIQFGNTTLKAIFTPGHSPASLSFYCEKDRFLIAGDVLFKNSIGRYDLPGGNLNTLMKSIKEKLMILPDDVKVHSGHGPSTTIGEERRNNPYLVD
jgi:hydroxyacylglutathione hydrolase